MIKYQSVPIFSRIFEEESRTEHVLALTSQIVFFVVLICGGLMLAYLLKCIKKQPYSYQNAALTGGMFFLGFVMLTVFIPQCVQYSRSGDQEHFLIQLFGNVLRSVYRFTILLLPVLLLLFLSLTVSNIALIRHEGKSPRHLLGALVSGVLILLTILNLHLWSSIETVYFLEEGGNVASQVFLRLIPILSGAVLCYLECVLIGISFCTAAAARKPLSFDQDYMLILGCAIRKDGTLYPLIRGRVDHARSFDECQRIVTGKPLIFVPTGGKGSDECVSEAEAMERYLLEQGVEPERILIEKQSANTFENMLFSKKLIDERHPNGAKVAFSTTNYHVFRAGVYAARVGLNAQGTGSVTKWYFWPNAFVREMIALLVDRKWTIIINIGVIFLVCLAIAMIDWRIVLM